MSAHAFHTRLVDSFWVAVEEVLGLGFTVNYSSHDEGFSAIMGQPCCLLHPCYAILTLSIDSSFKGAHIMVT